MRLETIDTNVMDEQGNPIQITFDSHRKIRTADDGLGFFISQLAYVEAKIYEAKYRNIVYQDFIPVDTSAPEWVDEIDYISYDTVTKGEFLSANAENLPESNVSANKSVIRVFYGGNSYSYSLEELRKSQQLRIPLDTTKGRASFRGFQEHAQTVAFEGDAARSLTGLYNNATIVAAKATSTLNWNTASGQAIVSDMNNLLIKVWEESSQVHTPNAIILPANRWAFIDNSRMDSGTDTSILEYFKRNNLYSGLTNQDLSIKQNLEIQTAGTEAAGDRMMAYELNDENLTMQMPLPWRSLAPQPEGLRILIPAEYKFGGVEFRYLKSAAYEDFTVALA